MCVSPVLEHEKQQQVQDIAQVFILIMGAFARTLLSMCINTKDLSIANLIDEDTRGSGFSLSKCE